MLSAALRTFFLVLCLAAPVAAQQRRSPTDDVLDAMRRALNDVRYGEALRLGRDLESFVPQMRAGQVVALRQLLALAHYPEEPSAQRPDSALRQLAALVRVAPEARFDPEYAWSGLDSLLTVARERTFGFTVLPGAEYVIAGADATADVPIVSTRAAVVRAALVHRTSGRAVPQDSARVTDRGTLRLRAQRDGALLIEAADYDLRVVATDARSRDSIVVVRPLTATAAPVTLQPVPVLDAASLKPERLAPDRVRTIVTGVLAGAATALVGSAIRGGGTIPDTYAADSRAGGVGAVIALSSVGIAVMDKGREIPEAVEANAALRAAHADKVESVRAENARRLAAHRVTLRFAPEDR